ncbi:hypothetical protein ACT3RN_00495 [Psychrobacter sp. AOP5-GZ1-6]|uniref:hypothetical protein n=1 Tax=unclassified Psychrobacter TaxID=196806 RepID=UPI001787C687|nr:hypothetical protein [Psychrobacter sp. FME13]MBE0440630.1 hypothetical protein [Psychrobacter sp. FME13]
MPNAPATNKNKTTNGNTIGSTWGEKGLNKNLVVKIRPVIEGNIEGGQGAQTYEVDTNQPTVESIFEDAEFTIESQYSTPFESSNPEGRLPNLMGMIQSGQAAAAGYSLFAAGGGVVADAADAAASFIGAKGIVEKGQAELEGLLGKSNFTKLNSRQIFTSSNSVRITGSLVFQAWADAATEVEAAVSQLQRWASAKSLSNTSLIVGALDEGLSAMFPSEIPPMVQLQYGGKTYKPLVIESVSAPITAPMTKDGNRIAVKVQVTFLSLTAWDQQNIIDMGR